MPWESNAAVKKSVKGLKKYTDSQVSKFRSAANSAYAHCQKKKKGNCDSYAIAVGWTALKGKKSKNEDGTPIEGVALMEALVDCLADEEVETIVSKLEGSAMKITVSFYDKNKKPETFTGDDLSYEICDKHYRLYIREGSEIVAVYNSWTGVRIKHSSSLEEQYLARKIRLVETMQQKLEEG